MFCKILESEPELCKELIELLLHVKIDHLEFPQAEKSIDEFPDAKSIRLDVYTKDDKRIFDLEMQAIDTKNLAHRARYYQSIIDMDNLSKGENYSHLKDSYVIFICLQDIFDKGLPVYSFENICVEDKELSLKDGTFKVFFNAEDCDKLNSEKERDFFKFLKGQGAGTDFSKRLESKVLLARKNAIWRKQYMTWQQTIEEEKEIAFQKGKDEGISQGIEQGITQGLQEAQISAAKNLLKMNLGTTEQIAEATQLPLETVLELKSHVRA